MSVTPGRVKPAAIKPSRDYGGTADVASLFVPASGRGIRINIAVRPSRNSDARRRLARAFDSRRVVS